MVLVGSLITCPAYVSPQLPAAIPENPVDVVLEAFRTHPIVALGEGVSHGDETAYQFRLALIRDPRFTQTVTDVVVEFGSARYQDTIDRFTRGESVSENSLRHVWQDTTQPSQLADATIYQDFFRAVRSLNATLPEGRQLRVLLGDPPIEWERVTTPSDFSHWLQQRDSFPAGLIQREVLAKGRRALLVYGQMHFQRRQFLTNYDMSSPLAETIVSLIQKDAPRSVFTIWPISDLEKFQPDVASWPAPSVAKIRGTSLGAVDFAVFRPANEPRMGVEGGRLVPIPPDKWKSLRAEEQLDAVLYEGPRSAISFARTAPSLCADPEHLSLRLRRADLAGLPPSESERLRHACSR